ncbi:MAG: ABC transporter ATP-binding protein [Candidatus Fimisoma sp.]|jgi:ABC-2 type transport system ATP-binding protein|nr:ABC transporter ATP-binding protein [Bacillota bacterium]MDD7285966.1 ABC transporter ATP-binding protein [Bacillota bacterium]MDY4748294.1 ABC transporter ATP-binding protein [Candidatus Fimisoma sp.]
MNVIETKNLTKFYGKTRGIKNLNLTVKEGEFFGFIGPNGAGKSTAIRTLMGLIAPTSGEASVLGLPLGQCREYLRDVGYLPSEAAFYNDMKVRELISYSAKLRGVDCSSEADRLCSCLELDTSKRIDSLSLGNRKKVGIVCAMQHRPKLYIMDEPTSGLDPLMQKEFFRLLRQRQQEGATVFFSSHVLSEVQHNCTRAAIIREGSIVAEGSIDELSGTSAKRVVLHGVKEIPAGIDGRSVVSGDDSVSFLYQGDIKLLLRELSSLPVKDVNISDPELEEIFMHYYQQEGR